MELINHLSAFQNCQNLSDAIAEAANQASDNSESIKSDWIELKYSVSVMASWW